jgi:hypothetical protein
LLDGDETRLGLSIAALLLLWSVAAGPELAVGLRRSTFAMAALPAPSHAVGEFDPESHLRPPPLR